MKVLAAFVAGCLVIGLPAYWWARTQRAHSDYKGAKAAVPKARAVLIAAIKKLAAVSVVALIAIVVALYAAARRM